jgi:NAD(P)-dependent dehydrogenase (short-subunit alcohol dehydrogenase family)
VNEIRNERGSKSAAHGFLLDATDESQVSTLIARIEQDIGPIHNAVYNLGCNMGPRLLADTPTKVFDNALKIGARGAYLLARHIAPPMKQRRTGSIIFTGATASVRGQSNQHAHSAGMAARRALAMSLAHELAPHGVHVAHVVIDALVDSPDTLGRMFPAAFERARRELMPLDGIVRPAAVADAYYFLHSQARHCRTFELDLRTWRDDAWFNSPIPKM